VFLGGGGFDEKRALCRFVILELSYKSIANRNVIIDTVNHRYLLMVCGYVKLFFL
jgi:hypothetical protein